MKNSQSHGNGEEKEFTSKKRERMEYQENLEENKINDKNHSFNYKENSEENDLNSEINIVNNDITNKENPILEENDARIIPKSEKDPSKCLLITNLQRPFVNSALESLLAKYGKITKFWLDFIKTHCYIEYENINQAKFARESLYGSIWPVDGKRLIIDFVPESEIQQAMEKNQSPYMGSNDKDKLSTLKIQLKPNDNLTNSNKIVNNIIEEEPVKTLDNLFKKTQTKPHIYFLPLTEEEVQEKRQKLNK